MTERLPTIQHEIPDLSTRPNADGGLDIVAGARVIGTLELTNVEEFCGVIYYDLDIRPRSYGYAIKGGEALRTWTRLKRSGAESVTFYPTPTKDSSP